MSNFFTRMLGGGLGAVNDDLSSSLDQADETLVALEGMNLPVSGDSAKVLQDWGRKLGQFKNLPTDPTNAQVKSMAKMAGGMPIFTTTMDRYYEDANAALTTMTGIAKKAIQFDEKLTQTGFALRMEQMAAASRLLTKADGANRQGLLFQGLQAAAGGNVENVRRYGAQAGGFM